MEDFQNDIDAMQKRSLPIHERSELRTKFDHTLRKPIVTVGKKKKGIFSFGRKTLEFLLLDVSPNGACIIAKDLRASPFNLNEEIIIEFPNGIERAAEVRWQLKELEVSGYDEKKLGIGLQLTEVLTQDEMLTI
ncbi:PilZ domain-containing protein [Vibrio sp. Y2-5]|uniref:PilZ domain-containing protein n=1 Tax=Vibrio sp. Y2-5 TaxID=2743977 RepID=UPI0016606636|nr:PilZ domain-containing protein [Vibrio sp. Y2-5]MBD0788066.1 PilZ domain-containing protein [Vibrio sp. Y2-5]